MNKFYVYAYLDPRKSGSFSYEGIHFDYEPFYIGKGQGARDTYHLGEKATFNVYKHRRIKKIQEEGMQPIILRIQENMAEEAALALEKHLIEIIGRSWLKTGPLTNLQEGGIGGPASAESRRKNSEAHKGKNLGKENPGYGKSVQQRMVEKYGEEKGKLEFLLYLDRLKLANQTAWKKPERRQKQSDSHKGLLAGEKNPMHGTSTHEQMLRKYGIEEGERKYEEYRAKLRASRKKVLDSGWISPQKGKSREFSKEHLQHIRDAQKRRREREAIESH